MIELPSLGITGPFLEVTEKCSIGDFCLPVKIGIPRELIDIPKLALFAEVLKRFADEPGPVIQGDELRGNRSDA